MIRFVDFRRLDPDTLKSMLEAKSLVNIPGGTLLSVTSATKTTGEYGVFALVQYSATINGKKEMGTVKIPNSILESTTLEPPCFLLYKGMKPTKAGRTCHAAVAYKPDGLTLENMEKKSSELRRLSFAALDSLISSQTLDAFVPGTMFLVKNPVRKSMRKESDDVIIVEFETVLGASDVKGTLILPLRLESLVKQDDAVILWYGGKQPMKDGKSYHDIKVLDEAMATAILKGN